MRLATQEVFTHGNECGKVRYGVQRKVVELSTEVIQEITKERVGWHRETWLHVGDEERALPWPRRKLDPSLLRKPPTPFRQPPTPLRQQSVDDESTEIFRCGGRRESITLDTARRRRNLGARPLLPLLCLLQFRRLVLCHRRGALRCRAGSLRVEKRKREDWGPEEKGDLVPPP